MVTDKMLGSANNRNSAASEYAYIAAAAPQHKSPTTSAPATETSAPTKVTINLGSGSKTK